MSTHDLQGLTVARIETFPLALPTLRSFAVSGGSVASRRWAAQRSVCW